MYFPLRVSGNCDTHTYPAGDATAPFSSRTSAVSRRSSSSASGLPPAVRMKASGTVPFSLCGAPTTIALPTGDFGFCCLSLRMAPSISSVPSRCPDVLMTSSDRPCSVSPPSS